jgi:hypothetical protein
MFYRKILDELHSWSRKKEKFIPIEVKSGKSGTLRSVYGDD